MKTAVLLTTHMWNSQRRAGFHWIAESLWRKGWQVYFVTGLSMIGKIKNDYRWQYIPREGVNQISQEKERFYSYAWFNWWHPTKFPYRVLNALTYPWFAQYGRLPLKGLKPIIQSADLIIYECVLELLYFEKFKQINPQARYVYRVSDDLHLANIHQVVLDAEARYAPKFDLVSVPTPHIYQKFAMLSNAKLQKHGVPTELYEKDYTNPYTTDCKFNAIYTGNLRFDSDFLERASKMFPEVMFHIIGPIPRLPDRKNIIKYGEMPYQATIPYVKYATISLNPLTATSFADSNKVMQYTFCQLPIVTSSVNRSDKPHVFYYDFGDDASIRQAIHHALEFDHSRVPTDQVWSWDNLVSALTEETSR